MLTQINGSDSRTAIKALVEEAMDIHDRDVMAAAAWIAEKLFEGNSQDWELRWLLEAAAKAQAIIWINNFKGGRDLTEQTKNRGGQMDRDTQGKIAATENNGSNQRPRDALVPSVASPNGVGGQMIVDVQRPDAADSIAIRSQIKTRLFLATFKMPDGRSLADWTAGEVEKQSWKEHRNALECLKLQKFYKAMADLVPPILKDKPIKTAVSDDAAEKLWKQINGGPAYI